MQLGCIFLLLFAQQAALTHAVWHAHQQFPTEHPGSVQVAAVPDDGAAGFSGACAFDAALGQMLGAAPCGNPPPLVALASGDAARSGRYAFVTSEFLAPRSRGPPALPMT